MLKKLSFSVSLFLLFSQCTQEKPDIRVGCEATSSGYYLLKWETFPQMEGTVEIYESSVPDSFNLYTPIAKTEINKGFIKGVFFIQPNKRSYFKLVFNKKYEVITAERIVKMDKLFNFRDLGGYYNSNGKQIRWGKIYRSSSLVNATSQDAKILNNLGIRTVIDLRTEWERYRYPSKYLAPQIFNLPLRGNPAFFFADKILSGEKKSGDIKVYNQSAFSFLLENNSEYFIEIFDILLDVGNYPVLINCFSGRERTAVVSALILAALDIDMDQIINEYMLTNEQIDVGSFMSETNIFLQDQEIQEAFTTLFREHRGTITYSFDKLIKEYGSLDNFFNNELNLTAKKREKLKEIMLY